MKILMRDEKNHKWEMVESNAYAVETELQELLASSPEIISMDEIRPGAGPLVAAVREFGLLVGSIDILAFTARGDIAIIECKLARNTQAKREVIGQILDYAAHLWGMTYEDLDQRIQDKAHNSLADLVRERSEDPDWDEELFRSNIRAALEQGNFILTIAVNEINDELHRIIRFVNSAGAPAFSFAALEMRRFHKAKTEMLVPHVFGTAPSTVEAAKAPKHKWDQESFFAALQQRSPDAVPVAQQLLAWAEQHCTVWWGSGSRSGSFVPVYQPFTQEHALFAVWTYARIEIYFYWYTYKPPFNDEARRLEILQRLNAIPGVKLAPEVINRRPGIQLTVFQSQTALQQLLAVFDWMLEEISKTGPST